MSRRKTKGELFDEAIEKVINADSLAVDYVKLGCRAFESRYDDVEAFLETQTITKRPRIKGASEIVEELVIYYVYSLSLTDEAAAHETYEDFLDAFHTTLTSIFVIGGVRGNYLSLEGQQRDFGWRLGGYENAHDYYMSKHPRKRLALDVIEVQQRLKTASVSENLVQQVAIEIFEKYKGELDREYTDVGYLKRLPTQSPFKTFEGERLEDVTITIDEPHVKRMREEGRSAKERVAEDGVTEDEVIEGVDGRGRLT